MAVWTVLPFLGHPVEYEAQSVEVADNGDLLVITDSGGSNQIFAATWPRDKWAQARQGSPPFNFQDPPAFANKHPNPYAKS